MVWTHILLSNDSLLCFLLSSIKIPPISSAEVHHEGVQSELCLWRQGELVCQIEKYFIIPVFKDPLSNLIDLFLKTCLVLKNKSIELKVINTVINFKWLVFWLSWASITPEILEYIYADNFHALSCYPWGVTWACTQCM